MSAAKVKLCETISVVIHNIAFHWLCANGDGGINSTELCTFTSSSKMNWNKLNVSGNK